MEGFLGPRHKLNLLATANNPRPLGHSAERAPLGGGGQILPPPSLPNSRTDGRSETDEGAIESS